MRKREKEETRRKSKGGGKKSLEVPDQIAKTISSMGESLRLTKNESEKREQNGESRRLSKGRGSV